jgi:hypothetical protein
MPYIFRSNTYGRKALSKSKKQDIINNLILDVVTGANLAYGLRKLRTGYTGNCIKVRRDNDNEELDIGFSGNSLDETALEAFVGENSAYITTWYDQSGNSVDGGNLVQATTARQPRIVNAGSVESGINFLGSAGADRGALIGTSLFSNKTSISMFFNITPYSNANLGQLMDKHGNNGTMLYIQSNNTLRFSRVYSETNVLATSGITLTYSQINKFLLTQTVGEGELHKNNVKDNSFTPTGEGTLNNDSASNLLIGQYSGLDGSFDGLIHEVIFYDKILNATEIDNINTL